MTMWMPLIIGGLMGCWAMLTLIGGERTRGINVLEARKAAAKAVEAKPTALATAPAPAKAKAPTPVAAPAPKAAETPAAKPAYRSKH